MHAHPRTGRAPPYRAASSLDGLIDRLAACTQPSPRRLAAWDRGKYHQRTHWRGILRRMAREDTIRNPAHLA